VNVGEAPSGCLEAAWQSGSGILLFQISPSLHWTRFVQQSAPLISLELIIGRLGAASAAQADKAPKCWDMKASNSAS
jgi:hypothetical protein